MKRVIHITGKVSGGPRKCKTVRFFLDSGATYSLLPQPVWKAIGLKPKRPQSFTLADGTTIERGISECYIVLPQGEGHTPVILGEEGDQALLGVVTLENLGLVSIPSAALCIR